MRQSAFKLNSYPLNADLCRLLLVIVGYCRLLMIGQLLSIRYLTRCFLGIMCCFLAGCKLCPTPFGPNEMYQKTQQEMQEMFAQQPPICGDSLDFNQALARGLQFNLDNRVKQVNIAIKAGQFKVAEYTMLPVLGPSGSYYNHNNDNATFGSNPDGTPSNAIAFGTDKTLKTSRFGVKWNLLDLGLGYVKTRQEGERILIAEEESRQNLQKLVQDIRVAYWGAYNAQQLADELRLFYEELNLAKNLLNQALSDKLIAKEDLFRNQTLLLEGNRRLVQLEDKIRKADLVFRYLINLPPDLPLRLERPPVAMMKVEDLRNLNFEKLDAITLANRPELRGQGYQRRIAELGFKAAFFQALPVVTLNHGYNFDSNSFLVNNYWNDRSIEANWNIFNLLTLPVSLRNVSIQASYESLKLMALTLGALNQTRIAYAHYQTLAKEVRVARNQTLNTRKYYEYIRDREKALLASKQQLVMAKLFMIYAKIDELLLMSEVSTALGELYIAAGFDVLPPDLPCATQEEVLCVIKQNLDMQDALGFKGYVNVTYNKLFAEAPCCPY